MTEEQRTKWLKVMSNEFMSSEESGNDSDDDIILHPIPWRSKYVSKMFAKIDAYNNRSKSSQARRQKKNRIVGSSSSRPCPTADYSVPDWAIAKH